MLRKACFVQAFFIIIRKLSNGWMRFFVFYFALLRFNKIQKKFDIFLKYDKKKK